MSSNLPRKRAITVPVMEVLLYGDTYARGYKTFFMLNSGEHEIFSAFKYENAIGCIFVFISREKFMLSSV